MNWEIEPDRAQYVKFSAWLNVALWIFLLSGVLVNAAIIFYLRDHPHPTLSIYCVKDKP